MTFPLPELASTYPHHKHGLPDPAAGSGQSIKHNRIPAPAISFERPNLPALIEEIVQDILSFSADQPR